MEIVVRASVMFLAMYLLIRLLGKRELGQMTPFEFVVLVVMGDLVQQGVTQTDFSVTAAILAISTFALWGLLLSWLSYMFPRLEPILEGHPRLLVHDGQLLPDSLHRDRMTRSELESEMRLAGIARLDDVAWACLEPNGKISFVQKKDVGKPAGGSADGARSRCGSRPGLGAHQRTLRASVRSQSTQCSVARVKRSTLRTCAHRRA